MLPVGLAAISVPRYNTPLRDGRGMLTASFGDGRALSRVSHWLCPSDYAGVGSVEPCAQQQQQQTDTESVPGRRRRGPCSPAVPVRGLPRGLGQAGGSACQPAEPDAFHL